MTTASIIIRTKNEAAHLGATLEQLLAQETQPHEIIVIDSGSTDRTVEIAERYPTIVMHIKPEEWNYSRAINRAAARATGEFLLCLSAHCRPVHTDWLDRMLGHFSDPDVAGVWGPGLKPGSEVPVATPPERQLPGSYTPAGRSYGLSNANSAIRRSLWLDCPFDERLPAAEDKGWAKVMLDRGFVIVRDPAAVVWHEPHPPGASFRRNQAIQAGYRLIFPELEGIGKAQVSIVTKRGFDTVATRVRAGDLRGFLSDIGRLPAIVASLYGGLRSARGEVAPAVSEDGRTEGTESG